MERSTFEVKSWATTDSFTDSRSAEYKGNACNVFKLGEFEAWVRKDDKEFVPVRLTKRWNDGSLRYDFQIVSEILPDDTVRLDHWIFKHTGIGGLVDIENSRADLKMCVINPPVATSQFSQLPFPTGTRINKDGQADVAEANTAVK